jgi:hypothetical protein
MNHSKLNSITLSAGPSLKLADQDVMSMSQMHLDDQLIIDSSARARDLLMVALALADEDMGWASWLDECWTQACRQQKAPSTDELREDPCWVLIATELEEAVPRFGWRIAGYRGETAFLAKPLWLLSDEERLVLLGWRLALPDNCAVSLREALNALGRALGAMLTDEPEPTGAVSMEEITQALSVRLNAFRAGVRKD